MITAKPFKQGQVTVISGPVGSEKTEELEGFLDSVVDSGFKKGDNIVVVRHPSDDKRPEYIGKHQVKVTDDIGEIYNQIKEETASVVIVGISHYNSEIGELAEAIVRSGRNLIASGLNLDVAGKPYGSMPGVMALADEVILAKAYCSEELCRNEQANRSTKKGLFVPVCSHHYHYPKSPSIGEGGGGELELYAGPMFSAKSTSWARKLEKIEKAGLDYVVFKWIKDQRYKKEEERGVSQKLLKWVRNSPSKEGNEKICFANKKEVFEKDMIVLHNKKTLEALLVRSANDIYTYLREPPKEHQQVRQVFIDEAQFLNGIYETIFDLIPEGYKFSVTGLPRGFNRQGFGEFPALMCLADKINMRYAVCTQCGEPATENQRIKIVEGERKPVRYDDPLVLVGGKEAYEARCLRHWVLEGEPPLKYKLEKFEF